MNTFENGKVSAIKQCERNLTFNAWEIGRHLKEGKFTFSYERGMAFKRLYEYTKTYPNLGTEIVKKIGVDKTLDLIVPLKSEVGEFLKSHSLDEIKEAPEQEVRDAVRSFKEDAVPVRVSRSDRFFMEAEVALENALGLFDGAISGKYRKEYIVWKGKERVDRLLFKLNKVIGGLN